MQQTLVLFLGAQPGNLLDMIVVAFAFMPWIPQAMIIVHILSTGAREKRSLLKEILYLSMPLVVGAMVVSGVGLIGFIFLLYTHVLWGPWLVVLLLPTLVGCITLIATKKKRRQEQEH